jgi:hypothetical protein
MLACVTNSWLWLVLNEGGFERFNDNWREILSWHIRSGVGSIIGGMMNTGPNQGNGEIELLCGNEPARYCERYDYEKYCASCET